MFPIFLRLLVGAAPPTSFTIHVKKFTLACSLWTAVYHLLIFANPSRSRNLHWSNLQSPPKAMKLITLVIVMMTTAVECFMMKSMATRRPIHTTDRRLHMSLLPNVFSSFSSLPLCDNKFLSGPSAPRSIVDDPTAGMSPTEIANYMDNVGGGMCGFPESVKTIVGVTLNLSLISFGIFTVSYIVLYAIQGFLNKEVEDTIKDADKGNSVAGAPMLSALTGEGSGKFDFSASLEAKNTKDGEGSSRKERRLREKVKRTELDK